MKMQKLSAVLMIAVMGLYAGEAVNFSGTWVPDDSKNAPAGEGPRMVAQKITVQQDGGKFTAERLFSNPMRGDFTMSEVLTLDGKECVSETGFGTRKSTAVWSGDQQKLTIKSLMIMNWNGEERQMHSTEVWSMEDGLLKIESTRETPMGPRENVLYFKRSQE